MRKKIHVLDVMPIIIMLGLFCNWISWEYHNII